jgi:hypothetical protein
MSYTPDIPPGDWRKWCQVHHSVILELNIPSYRMEQAKKTRDPALENSETN